MGAALRRLLACLALVVVAAVPAASAQGHSASSNATAAFLVELRGQSAPDLLARLRASGGMLLERNLRIWRVPASLLPALERANVVRSSERDRLVLPPLGHEVRSATPSASLWWLRAIGAARLTPPGPGKPVAVVDTGVDAVHPEFAGRQFTLLNGQIGIDRPGGFHGTAVTSLIAGRGLHVRGVYPQAAVREWDAARDGQLELSAIIAGVDAAIGAGPSV